MMAVDLVKLQKYITFVPVNASIECSAAGAANRARTVLCRATVVQRCDCLTNKKTI